MGCNVFITLLIATLYTPIVWAINKTMDALLAHYTVYSPVDDQ